MNNYKVNGNTLHKKSSEVFKNKETNVQQAVRPVNLSQQNWGLDDGI